MKNRMQLSDLDHMGVGAIAAIHIESLSMLMDDAKEMADKAKKYRDWLSGAVQIKYADVISAAFKVAAKDSGVVHVSDDGFDIEADAKKTVAWDNSKLCAALDAMGAEEADHYAKVTVAVDERKYVSAPHSIKTLLEPARTVKVSKPSITITRKDS